MAYCNGTKMMKTSAPNLTVRATEQSAAVIRYRRIATIAAFVTVFAVVLAVVAGWYWNRAKQQMRASLSNEAVAMSALSRVAFEDHRPTDALTLGLAAWPRQESDDRPRLEADLTNISQALSLASYYVRQFSQNGPVYGALLSKDGSRILSWSSDKTRGRRFCAKVSDNGGVGIESYARSCDVFEACLRPCAG
jgi:hypothetical protein